jgi:hypothetical protein
MYERGWSCVYDYHWHAYPLEVEGPSAVAEPTRRWSAESSNGAADASVDATRRPRG